VIRDGFLMALPAAGVSAALVLGLGWSVGVIGLAFAVGHLVTLPGPSGGRYTLAPAVAVATAFVVHHPVAVLLCGGAVGIPVGWWLARIRFGNRVAESLFPATPAGLLAFSGVLAAGLAATRALVPAHLDYWVHLGLLVPACVAWYLVAAVVGPLWSEQRRRVSVALLVRASLRDGAAYLVLFSAGALYGVGAPSMGWWAVVLAGIPYAFAHLSFLRLATTQTTYRQTIRALGRIPEAGGYAQPGHAERTADLAAAVSGEVGFTLDETRQVEFAAFLCDIGRIVLADPTVAGSGFTTADLAQWSAAIVGEAPYLEPVARIVAENHKPYRQPGEERDPALPRGAQVVKIASAYDYHLAGGMEPVDALEMLHRGASYEYDPELVAALRRVLQRKAAAEV
jgi:hypothetical protein